MPRKSRLSDLKVLSEISNTPLIDLSMLLLVTFLITYPLMQEQAMHINLPVGKTQAIEPQKSHSVSIDREGQVFFDNKQSYYEVIVGGEARDYLICVETGRVIEFRSEKLRRLRDEICAEHGFDPLSHQFHIFGLSADGRQAAASRKTST